MKERRFGLRAHYSPAILKINWGRITVEGQSRVFKDVKLFPGGCREWDWNETGTRHDPGIQPADVEELLCHEARVLVLSRGMWNRLQVCPTTLEELTKLGIKSYVLSTEEAVRIYNELCAKEAVGALIHSTC